MIKIIPITFMNKKKIINIIITAISIIAGLVSSIMILNIYYSGKGGEDNIYSISSISKRAVGFYISLALFIIAIGLSIFLHFKYKEKRFMAKSDDIEIYNLLIKRKDITSLEEEEQNKILSNNTRITISLIIAIILSVGLIIFPICYLCNPNNFDANGDDLIAQAISLAAHTLPFLVAIYIFWIAFYYYRLHVVKNSLSLIRKAEGKEVIVKDKKKEKIIVNVLRGVIFVVAVTFIILGIVNKEVNDVLLKAINICTECIGLG